MKIDNTSSRKLLETVHTDAGAAAGFSFVGMLLQIIGVIGLIGGGLALNDKLDKANRHIDDVETTVNTIDFRVKYQANTDVSVYVLKDGKYVKAEESSTWNTYYYTN